MALIIRLALLVSSGAMWAGPADETVLQSDAIEYHLLGRAISETGRYVYDYDDPIAQRRTDRWEPEPLRPPGYPAVVAGVYALTGPHPGGVLLLQAMLEALTCLLLAWTLSDAIGRRGAGVAALVYALHPGVVLFSALLLSEAVFALCLVGGFALLVRAVNGRLRWGALVAAGVVLGLAALVRPVLQVVVLLLAPVVLATLWPNVRHGVAAAVVFVVAFSATLAPWMAHNAARYGAASLSTSSAFNLMTLYAAPVEAVATGVSVRDVERGLYDRAETAARQDGASLRSDFDRAPYWSKEAVRVFQQHPIVLMRQQAAGAIRLWVSTGRLYRMWVVKAPGGAPPGGASPAALARWWLGQPLIHRVLDVWTVAYVLVVYPLLALGLVRAWRRRRQWPRALGLAAALALMLVVVTGTPGHSRFMAPIVPFWAPFVALGAAPLLDRRRGAAGSDAPSGMARVDGVSPPGRG